MKDLKKEIEELMEIINWTSYVEVDVFEEKSSLKKQEKVAGDLIRRKALDFLVKIKLQERKKTLEEVSNKHLKILLAISNGDIKVDEAVIAMVEEIKLLKKSKQYEY